MNQGHLDALNARHASLEAAIHAQSKRPMPDETEIARLKREKLRLKEELERLALPHPARHTKPQGH